MYYHHDLFLRYSTYYILHLFIASVPRDWNDHGGHAVDDGHGGQAVAGDCGCHVVEDDQVPDAEGVAVAPVQVYGQLGGGRPGQVQETSDNQNISHVHWLFSYMEHLDIRGLTPTFRSSGTTIAQQSES